MLKHIDMATYKYEKVATTQNIMQIWQLIK